MKPICLFTMLLLLVTFLHSTAIAETNQKPQINNQNKAQGDYIRKRFLRLMNKPFDNNQQKQRKILIIGDSHAQDFLNAIAENNLFKNDLIRTRYIPTRCQIYLGNPSNRQWLSEDNQLCNKADSLENAKNQIADADIIILAAMWRKWAAVQLPQTLANLKLSLTQEIFVVGRRSFSSGDNKSKVVLSKNILRSIRKEVDIHQVEINQLMSDNLDHRVFINTHKLVCGSGTNCPVYTDKFKMITHDGGHLSPEGARYFGKLLFERSQLSTSVMQ